MINSDDPAYFGGYMNDNWLGTFAALNLSAEHAVQLAKNSFEASFCNPEQKRSYIDRVAAMVDSFS